MLRLSKLPLMGAAVAALLASAPASAQVGLESRLNAQEQQLAQAEKTCGEVNLAEYANLLQEASKNKQRAEKAKNKGVPVDETQINADLAKAMALFARAQSAQARKCMMQAQAQPGSASRTAPNDFYANAVPERGKSQTQALGRSRTPAVCSYETMTYALDKAGSRISGDSCFDQRILDLHNAERAAVGAPSLVWSPQLAADATAYAAEMARTGQLVHASREGRGIERENINEAFHGSSPEGLMRNWLNEKSYFHAGTFPNVCTSGDWSQCAHYSQMIWPTTTDVGCGVASGVQWDFFVCRYSPGGNKDGKPVGVPVQIASNPPPPPPPPDRKGTGIQLETAGRPGGMRTGGDFGAMIAEGPGTPPPPPPPRPSTLPFTISFHGGRDDITPKAAAILDNAGAVYRQVGRTEIVIEGPNSNEQGKDLRNARLKSVEDYLNGLGIPQSAMDSGNVQIIFSAGN